MLRAEDNDVIQAMSADRTNEPFGVSIFAKVIERRSADPICPWLGEGSVIAAPAEVAAVGLQKRVPVGYSQPATILLS